MKEESKIFDTKINEKSSSRSSKRKTSESANVEDIPGPSGLNKHQKLKTDTKGTSIIDKKKSDNKTSLTSSKSKDKRKISKKTTSQKRSLKSAESEGSIHLSSSPTIPKKSPLKKSKSDSVVTASTSKSKQGQKRKTRKQPIFSPKKLRSSTHAAASFTTSKNRSGSQGEHSAAKTGARTSRLSNPPAVDQPVAGGTTSDKLGSCASRR